MLHWVSRTFGKLFAYVDFYIRCSLLPIGTLLVYIFAPLERYTIEIFCPCLRFTARCASYIAATKAVAKALLSRGATMKNLNFLVEGFAKMAFFASKPCLR